MPLFFIDFVVFGSTLDAKPFAAMIVCYYVGERTFCLYATRLIAKGE